MGTDAHRRHLVVIGGGIAGLAASWEASSDPDLRVTVLEAAPRLGGKIHTSELDLGDGTSMRVDEGADAFLARVPDAVELCSELGLADELTEPAVGRAKVLAGGELRDLPTESVLGVPLDLDELAGAGILSDAGLDAVRTGAELARPAPDGDVTIRDFLADRYGPELVDRLVGPLIGGINAGDVAELSLSAVTPQLADAAAEGGVLADALLRRRVAATGPVFHALRAGTGRLIDVLADALRGRGVELRTGSPVAGLTPLDDGSIEVRLDSGIERADAVVLATPAPSAAAILHAASPDAAGELSAITHSSPVLVTLVYDRSQLGVAPEGSGFLVPREAAMFCTAVSFGSTKWSHWDDGRHVILRASAGHTHDRRPDAMTDDEVVDAIVADLAPLLQISGEPITARVSRYPDGFAQYTVGHLDRVDRIEAALARDLPALRVAGSAYRGVGIPASIRSGRLAARSLLPFCPAE